MPPFVKLFLSVIAYKKAKWKLIFVKASLKYMRVWVVWSNTKYVILIVEVPHVVFVLTDPPTDSAPSLSVHPSLLLLSHSLLPSLPPASLGFFFPGVQCCSRRFNCQQRYWRWKGVNWCCIQPEVWLCGPDLLFIPLLDPNWPIWAALQPKEAVRGRVRPSSSWSLKWPRQGLDSSAVYCQQGDTWAGNSSSVWWWVLMAVFLWKRVFFWIRHRFRSLSPAKFYVDSWKNLLK